MYDQHEDENGDGQANFHQKDSSNDESVAPMECLSGQSSTGIPLEHIDIELAGTFLDFDNKGTKIQSDGGAIANTQVATEDFDAIESSNWFNYSQGPTGGFNAFGNFNEAFPGLDLSGVFAFRSAPLPEPLEFDLSDAVDPDTYESWRVPSELAYEEGIQVIEKMYGEDKEIDWTMDDNVTESMEASMITINEERFVTPEDVQHEASVSLSTSCSICHGDNVDDIERSEEHTSAYKNSQQSTAMGSKRPYNGNNEPAEMRKRLRLTLESHPQILEDM